MWIIKQSTAVTVTVGPFVDDTDFKSVKTGLSLVQADFQLSKNGGSFAQKNDATSGSHLGGGYYSGVFNSTDSGTLGMARLSVQKATALAAWEDLWVVTADVWDAWFGATKQPVNAVQVGGSTLAATALAGWSNVQISATAATGTLTTTTFTSSVTGYASKQLLRRILRMTSGSAAGEKVIIVDYNTTGGTITVAPPLTAAPANGNTFIIE